MIDFKLLEEIIRSNNSFVLTTHVNPDADAIGSEMALYYILKKMDKNASIINHSKTPYYLQFLDPDSFIKKYNSSDHDKIIDESDVIIFLDLNQANRVRSLEPKIREMDKLKICIDHHQQPEDFVQHIFIDTDYSATSEIIYDLVKKTNLVEFDYKIAESVYAGIMTDTGSFRFQRTSPKIHRIAAELLELGVDPIDIYDKIYDQSRQSKMKLLGRAINSMEIDASGKIAYMVVTQKDMKETDADESEVDGFVNYCMSIQNIQIGLLFFELKNGLKVSFRSKWDIPINKLAEEYGGGGHVNAAGTRLLNVEFKDYMEKIIQSARKLLR